MFTLFLACTGGSSPRSDDPTAPPDPVTSPDPTPPVEGAPTWWRDVRPVVSAQCANCHQDGDIGPFPLTTYAETAPWASAIAEVTAAGSMPPWPPSADCAPLQGDRRLSPDALATLAAWAEAGAPEGDPADGVDVEEPPPFVGDVDLAMAEPYTPSGGTDDYRCFVVDWPGSEPAYVTAYQVFPGARELVHHVILYLADADDAAAADAADEGPGYTCFGSSGVTSRMLGSWVPGVTGIELPAGTGVSVEPGTAVVMQMHYNTISAEPRPDTTEVALVTTDAVDEPAEPVLYTNPAWLVGGMQIPAGDGDVVHTTSISGGLLNLWTTSLDGGFGDPLVLSRIGLHMHTLGTSATLKLKREDGTEQCLLDIPAWDFHWQGGYNLVDPVTVAPGDELELTCHWRNDGPGAIDVNWGEGTQDEMCLSGLYLSR
ncbi:MAG: monooxygenase [Myxococcota bacterium]